MENQRIRAITDAAARLFLRQGYSKTQIGHIAKVVGVSVGTIYHDFVGKQEILHLVLKSTLDPDILDHEFQRPIDDSLFPGLEEELMAAFGETARAFASRLDDEDYHFDGLLSDAFDLLSRYAVGCLFLERNEVDFPALAARYRACRSRFFQTMEQYVDRFLRRGELRPLDHPELSTVFIIETLTWWAMDLPYLSFEPRDIPPGLAKEVCVNDLLAAYRRG